MATEAPDPRAFKSWEDAFQYPIPLVRKLEHKLRANLTENQEKLRSLVGANYRDLLATAERIIDMDEQMQQTETILGKIGRKCNSRTLYRLNTNYSMLQQHDMKQNAERYTLASQLAVLQACQDLIHRKIVTTGSPLLIAKLLVISRLLHKSLSQLPDPPSFVEKVRMRLSSLRRWVLNRIDHSLSNPEVGTTQMLECMCAFSLATSSAPTDILRYFHHVRLEAITHRISNEQTSSDQILEAFKIYINTLRDTESMIPERLAAQLAKLKAGPLLQDPDIRALDELNLGVHERWLPDDVKHFMPWPRHDELKKPDADRSAKSWANQALSSFLQGLKSALGHWTDPIALLDLRKELVETILLSQTHAAPSDMTQVLNDVRSALNFEVVKILTYRVDQSHLITSEISGLLASWEGKASSGSSSLLWDSSLLSMELSGGGKQFLEGVIDRRHGRTNPVLRVVSAYESWARSTEEAFRIIRQMKETTWDNDILNDEGELEAGSIGKLLNENDPREVEQALDAALRAALSKMLADVENKISALDTSEHNGEKAIFLIRVLREIRHRLVSLGRKSSPQHFGHFGISLIPALHYVLGSHVSAHPLGVFGRSIKRLVVSQTMPIRALWVGTSPLPVQPSPAVFRFLRTLVKRMAGCGADLWARAAVHSLKTTLRKSLGDMLTSAVGELKDSSGVIDAKGAAISKTKEDSDAENSCQRGAEAKADDEKKSDEHGKLSRVTAHTSSGETLVDDAEGPSVELSKDKIVQILFDILYLDKALAIKQNERDESLSCLIGSLEEDKVVNSGELDRLRKATTEYWRKTYLLFALLA